MKKIHRLLTLTILASVLTASASAQDPYYPLYDDTDTVAYSDSTSATRWSAYVPVVVLVAAAIFLSRAGTSGERLSSYYGHYYGYGDYYYSYFPYSWSNYYSGSYSGSHSNSSSYTGYYSHY